MRELEHKNLFKPPKGARVVVIPVCGEYRPRGRTMVTPMRGPYAELAITHFRALAVNVGILQWHMGVTPHPLTCEDRGQIKIPGKKKGVLRYHLVTLPTRQFDKTPISVEYLSNSLRQLRSLCDDKIWWLKEGDVILPQICDDLSIPGAEDHDWSYFKSYVETWLPGDRYVVISGKPGAWT